MTYRLFRVCKKSLSLTHDNPLNFVICEWQKKPRPNRIYLIYKILLSLYFLATLIYAIIDPDHFHCSPAYKAKWLIYLTYWTYIVCTLQAIWGTVMLLICFKAQQSEDVLNGQRKALRTYKFYWILHTVATDMALLVVVYYWLFVNDPKIPIDALNIIQHILTLVAMEIDFFLVSHPVRVLHFIFPILFGSSYGIVNAIYCLLGGTSRSGLHYIYKPLDWTKTPGKSVLVLLGTAVICVAVHMVFWILYRLRIYLRSILVKGQYFEQDRDVCAEETFVA